MGVMVDGVWHEELADPNPEGGSNLSSGGGGGTAPAQDTRAVGTNAYGDGIFNTPNGQKTGTQIAQELAAAGWDGVGNAVDVYNRTAGGGGGAQSGLTAPGTAPVPGLQNQAALDELGKQIDALYGAMASGNAQSFQESVRRFNATFGLDQAKFTEDVRRFNENLQIAQSGLTGTFQGQQTLPAQEQAFQQGVTAAGLTGYYQQPTTALEAFNTRLSAADKQAYLGGAGGDINTAAANYWRDAAGAQGPGQLTQAAQQQQYAQQMGMITTAAGLQANPFRQQQAIGQMGRLLGGQGVAGFASPNTVAGVGTAGGNTAGGMGYLQQMIDDIRDPAANQAQANQVLNAIPTPNKLDSVNFLRSSPLTQNMVLQGMQEKYGLSPDDALAQIKNTLPQSGWTSPTMGGIKR